MKPIQRSYSNRKEMLKRKESVVKSEAMDLMASITGCSYNKEEKKELLDIVKKELETAYTKI